MNNGNIGTLHEMHLKHHITTKGIKSDYNIDIPWEKLKINQMKVAEVACWKRKMKTKINKTLCFTEGVKTLSEEKKKPYLKNRTTKTLENLNNYKNTQNRANVRISEQIREQLKEIYQRYEIQHLY